MAQQKQGESDIFAASGWLRLELFEPPVAKALTRSVCWACDTRWDSLRTPHLFMGLLSTNDRRVCEWCRMLGTNPDSLLLQFAAMFTCSWSAASPVRLNREFISENAIRVLRAARDRSLRCVRDQARIADLLVSIFTPDGSIVADCFADVGYSSEHLAALAVAAEERAGVPESR